MTGIRKTRKKMVIEILHWNDKRRHFSFQLFLAGKLIIFLDNIIPAVIQKKL